MHRVLQQSWIEGKNWLVEEEHREALLDILNLLSEKAKANEGAVDMPKEKEEEVLEVLTEDEVDEAVGVEMLPAETISDETSATGAEPKETEVQLEGETALQVEGMEEVQGEINDQYDGDCETIPIWYYCPNGYLTKR